MSAGLGPAACVCVMVAVSNGGALCSGAVAAIDREQEETVNHRRGEGKKQRSRSFPLTPRLINSRHAVENTAKAALN